MAAVGGTIRRRDRDTATKRADLEQTRLLTNRRTTVQAIVNRVAAKQINTAERASRRTLVRPKIMGAVLVVSAAASVSELKIHHLLGAVVVHVEHGRHQLVVATGELLEGSRDVSIGRRGTRSLHLDDIVVGKGLAEGAVDKGDRLGHIVVHSSEGVGDVGSVQLREGAQLGSWTHQSASGTIDRTNRLVLTNKDTKGR